MDMSAGGVALNLLGSIHLEHLGGQVVPWNSKIKFECC